MSQDLPNVFSFIVYDPDLEKAKQFAVSLGYDVTVASVLPQKYLTLRRVAAPESFPPLKVGDLWLDISEHNLWEDPNFVAAKAAGVVGFYVRATIGRNGVDKRWVQHRNMVLKHGFRLGAYHYLIWDLDGKEQAEHFKSVVLDFCTEGPVCDVERRRLLQPDGTRVPEFVDKAVCTHNVLSFMNNVNQPDEEAAGIYTSKVEWEAMVDLTAEQVAKWWKWLAHWGATFPAAPIGWWPRLFQYRVAEAGQLSWYPRAVDLNRYMGERPPEATQLFRIELRSGITLNVRNGPGTQFEIVTRLSHSAGNAVQSVYQVSPNAWYKIRPLDEWWISGSDLYSVRLP